MRSVVGVLVCLALGSMSLALADQSTAPADATPPAGSTPAATPATPAAAPSAAAAPAAPAVDPDEKRLIGQGYKVHMKNGEKVFCKPEEELGSRLGTHMTCGTLAQIKARETETREQLQRAQRNQGMPTGK